MTAIEGWDNFYVIVGSSAGALIGLQFVVITLIADTPAARSDAQAGGTFTTPSVVHFSVVLFLSALASIPWDGIGQIAVLWAGVGLAGMAYAFVVRRRFRMQKVYQPVFEDRLFHLLLPFVAYAALPAAAVATASHPRRALFLVAASSLLLLYVGIHNAWDAVTYHVFVQRREPPPAGRSSGPEK